MQKFRKILAAVSASAVTAGMAGVMPQSSLTRVSAADSGEYYFYDTFEDGADGWSERGGCRAGVEQGSAYAGSGALLLSGRREVWNGGQKALSTATFEPGKEYAFSACFASFSGAEQTEFKLTLQYNDAAGETNYSEIDMKTTIKGKYVQLYNPSFRIPEGATELILIAETTEEICDFYVDEIIGAAAGTEIDGPLPVKLVSGDIDGDGRITVADFVLMKSGILGDFEGKYVKKADVNMSGAVNTKDAIMLKEYLLGMIDAFEKGENDAPDNSGDFLAPDEYMAQASKLLTTSIPQGITAAANGADYGNLKKYTYYSTTRERETPVNILLPPGYNENEKYPVLYAMHGYWENEDSLVKMSAAQRQLGNLIRSGEAEKMIIVFPYIYTSKTMPSCTGMDLQNSLNYDNFINDLVTDLMPYVEKNFSIKTGRENTAITGFSMGGRESLFIGLTRSDLFGYVGSACPAPGLTPGDPNMHPGQLQENQLKPAKEMPYMILVTAGSNDTVVYDSPAKYDKLLTKNGVNHMFQTIPGGAHGANSVEPHFYNLLRMLFRTSW